MCIYCDNITFEVSNFEISIFEDFNFESSKFQNLNIGAFEVNHQPYCQRSRKLRKDAIVCIGKSYIPHNIRII